MSTLTTGPSVLITPLLTLILLLLQNPSSRLQPVEDRCLLCDSTATRRDTHLLTREDTPPPGTTGLDTWAPLDHILQAGTKVVVLAALMTHPGLMGPTSRVLPGSMVADRLITTCQRDLMDLGDVTAPKCLTAQ